MTGSEKTWRELRFKMKINNEVEEFKAGHLLIANEILVPVLQLFEKEMFLWRIHRMFDADQGMNRFMFKFYGPEYICPDIIEHIKSYKHYDELKNWTSLELEGFLTQGSEVRDDNDGNWPDGIKEVWPYYIHGVSRAWLKMIEFFSGGAESAVSTNNFEEKVKSYLSINESIDKIWVEWGGHAMLHHLNAVFGYKHIDICCPDNFMTNIEPVILIMGEQTLPGLKAKIRF